MNWDAIGAIGEIAGAIGVIVSLIYLASQIRNQNTESRLTAINNMTSQWNAFMGDLATNTELARIWDKGLQNFNALDSTERVQFSTHLNRVFRINESMYEQPLNNVSRQSIQFVMQVAFRCPSQCNNQLHSGFNIFLEVVQVWYLCVHCDSFRWGGGNGG